MQICTVEEASAVSPGCYGAPSVFSDQSEVCTMCPGKVGCSEACMDTLNELREKIDVSGFMRRHLIAKKGMAAVALDPTLENLKYLPSPKKTMERLIKKAPPVKVLCDLSADDDARIDTLGVKPRAAAVALIKNGMLELIRLELQSGRSPYASVSSPDYRSVACDEFLKGSVTKSSLKKAYVKRLGKNAPWTDTTANSHVNIIIPVLLTFGIICAEDGPEGEVYSIVKASETAQ